MQGLTSTHWYLQDIAGAKNLWVLQQDARACVTNLLKQVRLVDHSPMCKCSLWTVPSQSALFDHSLSTAESHKAISDHALAHIRGAYHDVFTTPS